MTAAKEMPLMRNAHPGPSVASTRPPTAGPKAREALNCAELRVTALSRVSRGTSSLTVGELLEGTSSVSLSPARAMIGRK